jgi:6-phosphofructokinase
MGRPCRNEARSQSKQQGVLPELSEEIVNRAGRTGGTFLHSSRTNPSKVKKEQIPEHLKDKYKEEVNDLTPEVLKNLAFLGIDYMIPIGGDDTLSYGVRLYREGFKVIAIPKTMDNDVPGTDYCIGFSTCITRTIMMTHILRTSAGSHERFLVLEVFGRYAGFTAMLPTMAGAANRCVIPEYKFDMEKAYQTDGGRPEEQPQQLFCCTCLRRSNVPGRRDGVPEPGKRRFGMQNSGDRRPGFK